MSTFLVKTVYFLVNTQMLSNLLFLCRRRRCLGKLQTSSLFFVIMWKENLRCKCRIAAPWASDGFQGWSPYPLITVLPADICYSSLWIINFWELHFLVQMLWVSLLPQVPLSICWHYMSLKISATFVFSPLLLVIQESFLWTYFKTHQGYTLHLLIPSTSLHRTCGDNWTSSIYVGLRVDSL